MGSIAHVFGFLDECDRKMKDKEGRGSDEDKEKIQRMDVKWSNKKFKNTMFLTSAQPVGMVQTGYISL